MATWGQGRWFTGLWRLWLLWRAGEPALLCSPCCPLSIKTVQETMRFSKVQFLEPVSAEADSAHPAAPGWEEESNLPWLLSTGCHWPAGFGRSRTPWREVLDLSVQGSWPWCAHLCEILWKVRGWVKVARCPRWTFRPMYRTLFFWFNNPDNNLPWRLRILKDCLFCDSEAHREKWISHHCHLPNPGRRTKSFLLLLSSPLHLLYLPRTKQPQ